MGGKQKIGQGQVVGKNRRVLGDIGNLVTVAPAVEGKPKPQITRPATRSFCAQLLENAQAEKNKVKILLNTSKIVSLWNFSWFLKWCI